MNTLAQSAEAYTEGRIATASAIAQECLLHAQLHGDRRLEAQSLWQMAQVHMVCGEIESALSEGQNALLLFEALADREGETRSLITVAYAATQLRDNGLALASAGRAQRLSEGRSSLVGAPAPGDAVRVEDAVDLLHGPHDVAALARSGRRLAVPSGKTMLDILLDNGLNIQYACSQGVCGTCLTGVISGRPDHRDDYLTADEKAANKSIMVCCSGSLDETLVLDL